MTVKNKGLDKQQRLKTIFVAVVMLCAPLGDLNHDAVTNKAQPSISKNDHDDKVHKISVLPPHP